MSADPGTLVSAALSALPSILGVIREMHAANHPDAPPLTYEQVLAALQDAVAQSLAKDAQLRSGGPSAADLGVHAGSTGE